MRRKLAAVRQYVQGVAGAVVAEDDRGAGAEIEDCLEPRARRHGDGDAAHVRRDDAVDVAGGDAQAVTRTAIRRRRGGRKGDTPQAYGRPTKPSGGRIARVISA